jgi:hypothetical protein
MSPDDVAESPAVSAVAAVSAVSAASDEEILVRRARDALLAGARPQAVFATLAEDTHDYRGAALAVCTAAGNPRALALQRWTDEGAEVLEQILPSDPAEVGFFLELAGFFDVHRQLDDHEQRIRDLLDQAVKQAFATSGGLPSGYAHGLSRKLLTGRLAEAFIAMATFGARRQDLVSTAYWTHLLAAADLLAVSDDDEFESCVAVCRRGLAQQT